MEGEHSGKSVYHSKMHLWCILVAVCVVSVKGACTSEIPSHYNFDGCGNNINHPSWGSMGEEFQRIQMPHSYSDGDNLRGMNYIDRPSARQISKDLTLPAYKSRRRNSLYGTDMLTYIGQFIGHDISQSLHGDAEQEDILVPKCDEFYDLECTGTQVLPFYRSSFNDTPTTPRQQINTITSYLDGSAVYGSTVETADKLRAYFKGYLSTSNGQLPTNYMNLNMANPTQIEASIDLRAAGDPQTNSVPMLLALQSVFVKEHNRIADELQAEHPEWNDDDLFYEARKWVIAYLQSICYYEYLPIMGIQVSSYSGYDDTGNAGVDNFFSTVAYRYGITEVMDIVYRIDDNGHEIPAGHLLMKDSFYRPTLSLSAGIEPILRGASFARQGEVKPHLSTALQNYLYGTPKSGGSDLLAITIQRGRDHGIPQYNDAREGLNLTKRSSFSQITGDRYLQRKLEEIYGNVDKVDAYIGGLAEDSHLDSSVGELFYTSIRDQFQRLRNHDRFYFENVESGPFKDDPDSIKKIRATGLRELIMRNTEINVLPENIYIQDITQPWPRLTTDPKSVTTPVISSLPPPTQTADQPPKSIPTSEPPPPEAAPTPPKESPLEPVTQPPPIEENEEPDQNGDDSVASGELVLDETAEYILNWELRDDSVAIAISVKANGFAGIGIPGETLDMQNADVIAAVSDGNGGCKVHDYWAITFADPVFDEDEGGTDDIVEKNCEIVDGSIKASFVRPLSTGDVKDRDFLSTKTPLIYAYYSDSNGLIYHGPMRRGSAELDMEVASLDGTTQEDLLSIEFNDGASKQLAEGYKVWWKLVPENSSSNRRLKQEDNSQEIIIKLQRDSTGWMGMGIEPEDASISGMQNTDMYIGWVDDAGVVTLMDAWAIGFMKPESDVVQGGTDDIISFAGEEKDGSTIIIFKRKINTGDNLDRVIKNIDQDMVFAFGDGDALPLGGHGPCCRGKDKNNFMTQPKEVKNDPENKSEKNVEISLPPSKSLIVAHAWLMILSWCCLCIFGLVMSRLTRHWKYWMEIHMACEFSATLLSMIGEILSFTFSEGRIRYTHGALSFAILFTSVPQVFLGWITYNSSSSNFKKLHRGLGYFITGIAFWQMWGGMHILEVDERLEQCFFAWVISIVVSFHFASESVSKEEVFQSLVKRGFIADDSEANSHEELNKDEYPCASGSEKSSMHKKSSNSVSNKLASNKYDDKNGEDTIAAYKSNDTISTQNTGEIGEKITPNQFLEATGKNKPWTLIDGKVYNMQDMLTSHPGGPESIADIIGKDGTEPFMDHHAESEAAHNLLQETFIGNLVEEN